jgi:hypothetical protein
MLDWYGTLADADLNVLHHFGPEGKTARQASAHTGIPIKSINMGSVLKFAFDDNGKGLPFGMGSLALLCGWLQEHGALLDCYTQARVYGMLLRAIYRHFYGDEDGSA